MRDVQSLNHQKNIFYSAIGILMNSDFQIRLEAKSFPDAKDMLYSSVLIIFIK